MNETILIVDDDKEFREELRTSLDEYNVVEAGDGQETLQLLRKPNDIDLVILDNKMPILSGTQVLKLIKKREPDMCVVMLTGFGSKDTVVESLRGNADEYLDKPVEIDKLKEVVARLLEKKKCSGDPNLLDMEGKIEKVKRFIQRNCFKKTTLEDAARILAMSPKYLSKVFKNVAGMNFEQYKLNVKMQKAKELLKNTDIAVSHLSDKFEFQNPESFMRIFKKITKKTPTQYRKSISRRKN